MGFGNLQRREGAHSIGGVLWGKRLHSAGGSKGGGRAFESRRGWSVPLLVKNQSGPVPQTCVIRTCVIRTPKHIMQLHL